MKALLAAGGTGGHMFPAQSLAEMLTGEGWDVAMITDARGARHAGRIPVDPLIQVKAATLNPRHPLRAAKGVLDLYAGTGQAKRFMRRWQPDIVIGFGGYPAFPALRAAQALRVPYILHEQNAVLGRVNRVFAKRAEVVASGFERLDKLPAGVRHNPIGNPLRADILTAAKRKYSLPKPKAKIHLLVVGGSLGATLISRNVPQAVTLLPEALRKRLKVMQQARESDLDFARQTYDAADIDAECQPFFSDIHKHLAKAHFVIGRAGAGSVSEIALMGLPSLLVPLAIAMDDHQTANALTLKNLGAAELLTELDFTPEAISAILTEYLNAPERLETASKAALQAARPEAANRLAELVKSVVGTPT